LSHQDVQYSKDHLVLSKEENTKINSSSSVILFLLSEVVLTECSYEKLCSLLPGPLPATCFGYPRSRTPGPFPVPVEFCSLLKLFFVLYANVKKCLGSPRSRTPGPFPVTVLFSFWNNILHLFHGISELSMVQISTHLHQRHHKPHQSACFRILFFKKALCS
jgi:hypothetical protein